MTADSFPLASQPPGATSLPIDAEDTPTSARVPKSPLAGGQDAIPTPRADALFSRVVVHKRGAGADLAGPPLLSWDALAAVASVVGLSGSLIIYGVLQERIMTVPFGPRGALFRHSLFLVLCNRVVAALMALAWTCFRPRRDLAPTAPLIGYGAVSLANVVASMCQYEALKYVSFPVQVVTKCTKMIPVMVWQTAIGGKSYGLEEYLQAALVAVGCATFLLTGPVASEGPGTPPGELQVVYVLGGLVLSLYLLVDGFTSTWQDKLFSGYEMSLCNQVLYTSLWSIGLSVVGLVGTGRLFPSISFVSEYPEAWAWIGGISIASAAVQFFVSHTIKSYGALVFATVMTTRQWFSILLSCLVFAHPLSMGQW
eukprot:evm.model.scf_859EXC.4 EVM.evm.TU.scf_859EXC.4   scf_859EXC:29963-31069(-)